MGNGVVEYWNNGMVERWKDGNVKISANGVPIAPFESCLVRVARLRSPSGEVEKGGKWRVRSGINPGSTTRRRRTTKRIGPSVRHRQLGKGRNLCKSRAASISFTGDFLRTFSLPAEGGFWLPSVADQCLRGLLARTACPLRMILRVFSRSRMTIP